MNPLNKDDLAKLSHRFQVSFALFCAKQVLHLTNLKEAHECIRIVEAWLVGEASSEDCRKAADIAATYAAGNANANTTADAYSAVNAVAYTAAARAAARAYSAAAYSATAAAGYAAAVSISNKENIIKAQWDYYFELLEFDDRFENIVIGQ